MFFAIVAKVRAFLKEHHLPTTVNRNQLVEICHWYSRYERISQAIHINAEWDWVQPIEDTLLST